MARPLKARACYDEMRHAIGGQFSKETRYQDVLNDALADFTGLHDWSFLEYGEKYLDLRGSITVSGADWTVASLTVTSTGSFASYTRYPGDLFYCSAGGSVGYYEVASSTANTLVLGSSMATGNLSGTVAGKLEPRTVVLPTDFRSCITAGFDTGDTFWRIDMVSPAQVAAYQRTRLPSLNAFYGCIERVVDTNGDTIALLRIAPPSSTDLQSSLLITYKRRVPPITEDGDVVMVPDYCHRLVKDLCRAAARGIEMPDAGNYSDLLGAIEQGAVFRNAVRADCELQIEYGHIRNGHIPRHESALDGWNLGHDISIGGPT